MAKKLPRRRMIIAIDGPAGVGKSTVGSLVARKLGYHFINTGEMYRALTWKSLEEGVDLNDPRAVMDLAKRLKWEFRPTEEGTLRTCLNGTAVTFQIRDERVSRNSSAVAAIPAVRRFLCGLQRRLGAKGGIVMEGRDIATHVFPDAECKVYLDASIEERADRRYRQLKGAGHDVDRHKIKEDILSRDLNDLKRKINPLSQDPDAVLVDSTRMSLHEVAEKILHLIRGGARRRGCSQNG